MTPEEVLIESALALASSLPSSTVDAVVDAFLTGAAASIRAEITKRVPHHEHRDLALAFLDRWRTEAKEVDARTVAVALRTASISEQNHRDAQTVELVWTGPDTGPIPFRRTEQAILQVLDAAKSRITLVSFAVYRIPNIGKALIRAAKRGVRLTVIVETPDKIEGEGEYNTIKALGQEVATCSTLFFWPKENRRLSDNNKVGILHVKCAVADGEWLFLSSANLTEYAFTVNMELGLLVTGGRLPAQVEQHFQGLCRCGQLLPLNLEMRDM